MDYFSSYLNESARILSLCTQEVSKLEVLAVTMWKTLTSGNSIYWMGNGGSASDSEHLSAELAGRFKVDRIPVSSFSLTSNSSILTAIANDYGYSEVFSRQVRAYLNKGDLLIGISTSGKSHNILNALEVAASIGATTCIMTGRQHLFEHQPDFIINVDSSETCHIQEAHIAIGQSLCGYIEQKIIQEGLAK